MDTKLVKINNKELIDPRSYSPKVFLEKLPEFGINPKNGLRLLGAVLGNYELDPQTWSERGIIPKIIAEKLEHLPSLELVKTQTSKIDGFTKLLFKTSEGFSVETVIIPLKKENTVTICLSSQVGCVMGCTFCATARMKDRRNLKSWEIFDQLQQARKIAFERGQKVTGSVFMGMGEPFLNYKNVMITAELMCFPVLNAISSKSITISTVGVLDKIIKFTEEKRPFRLSISLGAATDEKRSKLVPVAAKTEIKKIMKAASDYAESKNDRVMLSYVCIADENIYEEDAIALANLIGDTKVRLDLIEVTDTSNTYRRPSEEELKDFRTQLNKYLKQPIVRRYSGGADINAACGTLAGQ